MASFPPPFSSFLLLLLLFLSSTITTTSLHPPSAEAGGATTVISPTKAPTTPTSPAPESPKTPSIPISSSTLDPKQIRALQSLNIPSKDPCSPNHNSTTICDSSKPFRHLISLNLSDCSDDVALSLTALKSLSTLTSLSFVNCPISPIHFPSELASNLRSFTCISSLKKLTGVWLSRLENVTDLTVSKVFVNASGPSIILNSIKKLHSVTISHANLTGVLPKHWHPNLTHVDLSGNQLKGTIPSSINVMEDLLVLDFSSNTLEGEIPDTIGDLSSLQNLSLSSNSLSGPIPDTITSLPDLVHLDLGSNSLNGTVPKFISELKKLKFLNLEKNNFHGILPFNASFFKRLEVFKIGGNDNLCYNHSTVAVKVKLGIAPCDKHGRPLSPPAAKDSSADDSSSDDDYSSDDEDGSQKQSGHHGPNKVVLGVAIGLSSIVFLIIFLVLLSKCCK